MKIFFSDILEIVKCFRHVIIICQVFESSILTGGALLCSVRTLLAVRNLNEISVVLRNILERRRGRLLSPGEEEEVITQLISGSHREHTKTNLTSSEYKSIKESWSLYLTLPALC